MSIGGSKNRSSSQAQFGENVWGPSGQAYQNWASGVPFDQLQRAGSVLEQHAPELYSQLSQYQQQASPAYQQQLGGGQVGQQARALSPALQASLEQSLSAPGYAQQVTTEGLGGNQYMPAYLQSVGDQYQRSFDRNVAPRIDQGAVSAGQSGSSRHGIAEGLARSDLSKQIGDTQAGLISDNFYKDLDFRQRVASQADANRLALQQSLLGQQGRADQTQQQALTGVLPSLQGSTLGQLSPFAFAGGYQLPYYQGFGGYFQPQVLRSGSQSGSGSGGAFGFSI